MGRKETNSLSHPLSSIETISPAFLPSSSPLSSHFTACNRGFASFAARKGGGIKSLVARNFRRTRGFRGFRRLWKKEETDLVVVPISDARNVCPSPGNPPIPRIHVPYTNESLFEFSEFSAAAFFFLLPFLLGHVAFQLYAMGETRGGGARHNGCSDTHFPSFLSIHHLVLHVWLQFRIDAVIERPKKRADVLLMAPNSYVILSVYSRHFSVFPILRQRFGIWYATHLKLPYCFFPLWRSYSGLLNIIYPLPFLTPLYDSPYLGELSSF